jgi:hypothetical protein
VAEEKLQPAATVETAVASGAAGMLPRLVEILLAHAELRREGEARDASKEMDARGVDDASWGDTLAKQDVTAIENSTGTVWQVLMRMLQRGD